MALFKRRPELPGKEMVEKISEKKEQTILEIAQGGNRLILDRYTVAESMISNESAGKSFPIVTAPVILDIVHDLPRGRHRIYLCSDKGATAELKPTTEAEQKEAAKKDMLPAGLIEDGTLWAIKSYPELVKKIVDANLVSNALGLLTNRSSLILGLVVGFLVGAVCIAFAGLVLVLAGFI